MTPPITWVTTILASKCIAFCQKACLCVYKQKCILSILLCLASFAQYHSKRIIHIFECGYGFFLLSTVSIPFCEHVIIHLPVLLLTNIAAISFHHESDI